MTTTTTFSVETLYEIREEQRKKQNSVAKYFLEQIDRLIEDEYQKYNDQLVYRIPRFKSGLPTYDFNTVLVKVLKKLRKHKNLTAAFISPDMIGIKWKRRERSKDYIPELLRRIEAKIRSEYANDINIDHILFKIPPVTQCYVYDIHEAAKLLMDKLHQRGFKCKFTRPQTLEISWKFPEQRKKKNLPLALQQQHRSTINRYQEFANIRRNAMHLNKNSF